MWWLEPRPTVCRLAPLAIAAGIGDAAVRLLRAAVRREDAGRRAGASHPPGLGRRRPDPGPERQPGRADRGRAAERSACSTSPAAAAAPARPTSSLSAIDTQNQQVIVDINTARPDVQQFGINASYTLTEIATGKSVATGHDVRAGVLRQSRAAAALRQRARPARRRESRRQGDLGRTSGRGWCRISPPATATTPGMPKPAGKRPGTRAASQPPTTTRVRNTTCWKCSPTRRGASIWAMSATTRWATWSHATSAPAASTSCTRWAGTPSACRPRTPPWSARSTRGTGPTPTSRRCATS